MRFTVSRVARPALIVALLAAIAPAARAAQQDGVVRGRITDPEGAPVARATVVLTGTLYRTESDADGSFVLSGIPDGRYRLRAERIGYAPAEAAVSVMRGAAQVVLTMTPVSVTLRELTVIGSREDLAQLRERLSHVPGSVHLIEADELRRTRQANFKDALRFTPGVYVQPRFGAADESQLSIRGSGLRNNFHLRGVNVLVNGMPYRNADGFTDFESLELLTTENIQIYKGANALRFGGATLGGAVNLETKTGHTAERLNVFAQGGSFGFAKAQLSSGMAFDRTNYYVSYAHTQVDGFRDFADQERDRVNGHIGVRLSSAVDARLFYFFAWVREDLPGALTREEFAANPRAANPTNVANRWGRDYTLHHVGLQLRAQLGPAQRLEVAPYGQFRDVVHPIFRVLDQVSRDVGLDVRYEHAGRVAGHENRLTVGFQPAYGDADNRHFENVGGERGDLAKDQRDEAATLAFYAEDVLAVTPRLSAVVGVRYDRALRRVDDFFLDDGDQSDTRWMDALSPKLGVIYELPAVGGQLFANASRAFEPPLLLELNSFTVPGFIDLEPQRAWQFEVGTRGEAAGLTWDVALYDMELTDEIININVQPFPGAPFTVPTYRNAPRTRHYGVEAGVAYRLPGRLFGRTRGGDELTVRLAYTFAWYGYVRDAEFEDNDIPGAPQHVVQAEVAYRHPAGLTLRPNIEWVPGDYFVNSQNTETNDGWTVLGVRAEWDFRAAGLGTFLEIRNLTDAVYSPAVSVDNAAGRFFQPGDGRSVYFGLRWQP